MYELIRDADFRLNGTVVWYDNDYAFVEGVGGVNGNTKLNLTQRGRVLSVKLSDPLLVVRSIPTGYVNISGKACFLKRNPARAYRQGLRHDNCSVSRVRFGTFIESVVSPLQIPLEEDLILSKDYAVINNKLRYHGRVVGVWVEEKPVLSGDKEFLRESLAEIQGGVL